MTGMPTQPVDPTDQLRKLAELRDAGILTDEEFAAKKAQLLARDWAAPAAVPEPAVVPVPPPVAPPTPAPTQVVPAAPVTVTPDPTTWGTGWGATPTAAPAVPPPPSTRTGNWWQRRSGKAKVGIIVGVGFVVLMVIGAVAGKPKTSDVASTASGSAQTAAPVGVSFAVRSPASGTAVGASHITVSGTAPAGTRIVQDISMASDAETTADANGFWSIPVDLTDGANDLAFRVGDDKSTTVHVSVTYTAEATAQPVAEVTEPPAPVVTEPPAPAVTSEPAVDPRWAAYTVWAMTTSSTFSDEAATFGEAATGGDVVGALVSARLLYAQADDALAWLNDNPPAPCYKKSYTHMKSAMTLYRRSFELFIPWAEAYPLGDNASIQTATNDLNKANAEVQSATDDLDGACQ